MNYKFKALYQPSKTWKSIILIFLLSCFVLYVAFMGLYLATSEPSFCASCHDIKPYVTTWGQSPHQDVKCLYCHEFRGFEGKLHSKSRGLNYFYQQLTGQHTILTKGQIFEQNCIACHLGDYKNYPKTKRMDRQHYDYIKQNKSCLQCHRSVGHEVNIFSKEKFEK